MQKKTHLLHSLADGPDQVIPSIGELAAIDSAGRCWQWNATKPNLHIWNGTAASSRAIPQTLLQQGQPVKRFLLKDATAGVFIFSNSAVAHWNLLTNQIIITPPLLTSVTKAGSAFIMKKASPDGRYAALANWQQLCVYDFQTGQRFLSSNDPHWAKDIAFSPTGESFATAGLNGHVQIRSLRDGSLLRTLTGHLEEASGIAYSPDGRSLVVVEINLGLRFWRTDTWRDVLHLPLADAADSLAFSPNGHWLAVQICPRGAQPQAGQLMLLRSGL
jgi:WD40 repeat protein